MQNLLAKATRWVSDEPVPGWVEVEFRDADGVSHTLADKAPIFSTDLTRVREYPVDVLVACEVVAVHGDRIRITTERPWGVCTVEGRTEFVVHAHQLVGS
ncbi:hypothetical protein [Kribbella shirazensis]|uniref:Uncharacterized protein n=1 Tax=Kribbella shirazensis TaxID=1105143 RepID=A0A7X5V9A9_9ACTN|nr:hypothetical protein [Kribbella shirazensis]NIK56953.1 hypothetical protein [Kribbella shirazensis]